MRIVRAEAAGGPEVLIVTNHRKLDPQPGEVLLEVAAAGVNRADLLQRMGHYPPPAGAPDWPGLEVSGRVVRLGEGVDGWQPGDQVCALLSGGGYAEQVSVDQRLLLPKPAGLDLVDTAALPEAVCTVWSNLVQVARLQPGETVLIHGGSSGIGTIAIQIARQLGARVAVTAGSAEKLDLCARLGAQITINYRRQDFVAQLREQTDGVGADVILDNMGAAYLARNVDALAADGRLVIIGMQGGTKAELHIARLLAKRATVSATSLRSRPIAQRAAVVAAVRQHVWPMVESGAVRPVLDRVLDLARAADAHRRLDAGSHVGKVVLTP